MLQKIKEFYTKYTVFENPFYIMWIYMYSIRKWQQASQNRYVEIGKKARHHLLEALEAYIHDTPSALDF